MDFQRHVHRVLCGTEHLDRHLKRITRRSKTWPGGLANQRLSQRDILLCPCILILIHHHGHDTHLSNQVGQGQVKGRPARGIQRHSLLPEDGRITASHGHRAAALKPRLQEITSTDPSHGFRPLKVRQ